MRNQKSWTARAWMLQPGISSKQPNNLCCLLQPDTICRACDSKWCFRCYEDNFGQDLADENYPHPWVWVGTICTGPRYTPLGNHSPEVYNS